jgi:hypothetical protein
MKNKVVYAIGVLLLYSSFAFSKGENSFAGNPIPPCGPAGCIPPAR